MADVGLSGRVALVTGALGGIGRALALRLAEAGCDVAVAYRSGDPDELLAALAATGRRAVAVQGDLADPDVPARLLGETQDALGPVDVLVANAGLGTRAVLADIDADLWQRTLAVNLTAPFLLCQGAVPAMAERGWGRVLLVSSVAAFTGGVVGPHYATTKAGLLGLTHSLAATYAGRGVTVNALAPALVAGTAMLPGDEGELAAMLPVGRLGTPGEVADLALAMLRNGYLTSQAIGLDGGMHPR